MWVRHWSGMSGLNSWVVVDGFVWDRFRTRGDLDTSRGRCLDLMKSYALCQICKNDIIIYL